jgi:hypothetical protein
MLMTSVSGICALFWASCQAVAGALPAGERLSTVMRQLASQAPSASSSASQSSPLAREA